MYLSKYKKYFIILFNESNTSIYFIKIIYNFVGASGTKLLENSFLFTFLIN